MPHALMTKAGALVLATALLAPSGALADHEDPQTESHNTSFLSGIAFNQNNIGEIILFMFNRCNAGDNTQMANGPFRRIDVIDSTSGGPVQGGGGTGMGGGGQSGTTLVSDSRLDYVTLDITSGIVGSHSLTGSEVGGIADQIGIDPGITLSVDIAYNATTDVLSVTDMSSGPSQILDLGGPDAVFVFDGEQNNRVRGVCDMQMWRDVGGIPTYGVDVADQTRLPSRVIVFWAAGTSAFAHQDLADAACDGVNIKIDATNDGVAPGPGALDDSREAFTVGLGGDTALQYGDLNQPANYTACTGLAGYCDSTETSPSAGDFTGDDETNFCNPAAGGGSPPNVSVLNVNEGNASCVKTVFGVTMRFDPCPPG